MRKIEGDERDQLILNVIGRIENDMQIVGGADRPGVWETGWANSLAKFRAVPLKESLIPGFIHINQPVRQNQEFWQPDAEMNELVFIRHLQREVLPMYMDGCASIAEFGCGTGFNLVELAEIFPSASLAGFDFAHSAVALLSEVNQRLGLNISADRFDMHEPYLGFMLARDQGVFTFGAIEQLAGRFHAFIGYLLLNRPKIVVHIEPVIELYDPANIIDALAIAFHQKRGYTTGLLPYLENHPHVEMIHVERCHFGSLMMEGYNIIAWRPK